MIALAMIIADKEPLDIIARCLYSVAPHVEGIYLTLNGKSKTKTKKAKELESAIKTLCIARKYPEPVIDYIKWTKNFSEARNHNFSCVPKDFDYILWLDSDDILRGGENLKDLEVEAKEKGFGAVFFNYLYRVELDEDMKIREVLIEHLRERLIRNDGSYVWVAPIHETLVPQRETIQTDSGLCDVVHLSTEERAQSAIFRNIEILEEQLKSQGTKKDPRTLYYLAKAYFDLRDEEHWNKAEEMINAYLNGSKENTPSGWGEERAQAWEYLAEIYRTRMQTNKAIKATANALIECPEFPNFYIDMALNYLYARDWKKARFWATLAQQVPYPKTTLVTNPRDMKLRTLEVLFNVAMNTNNLEEAWATAVKVAEIIPDDEMAVKRAEELSKLRKDNEAAHKIISIARYLNETNQSDKIKSLIGAIPKGMEEEPVMISLRKDFTPARKWDDDEIAIMCGRGFEKWSPQNLGKGIGGSEEAVIYLSRELSRMGWRVTVFGDPQDEAGEYEGVKYVPYYLFNENDRFNILIGWRNIGLFDLPIKAKKAYLWLHDIANPMEYTTERVDKITKIFALSKWHRDNIPNVPDEKFMITGNGINVADFEKLDAENIQRDPHRVFYGSSYDRGLEHLLNVWPDVKKAVPDATLHVCYGWKLFESFYRNNPERMAWKAKMEELLKQDGVTDMGRVSQVEVLRESYRSGVWAYPSHFGEISCINAMKNQASGAIPVVCAYAALKETVQYGTKINVDNDDIYDPKIQEEFKEALIKALKDTEWQDETRHKMMPWAREHFSWLQVALQWDKELKHDKLREAAENVLELAPEAQEYIPVELQERMGYEQTY
jgi:glycosyltransferase involved in cell wall biosynthesis